MMVQIQPLDIQRPDQHHNSGNRSIARLHSRRPQTQNPTNSPLLRPLQIRAPQVKQRQHRIHNIRDHAHDGLTIPDAINSLDAIATPLEEFHGEVGRVAALEEVEKEVENAPEDGHGDDGVDGDDVPARYEDAEVEEADGNF